ncbi:Multidrug resistance protein B [Pluralibacter gergoviae]|nr:Multidrug resistance protein B [Pluralibacter gergoviae]
MLNNASASSSCPSPDAAERQRTLATIVVSIAMVLEIVDVSILNVAIPVLQHSLAASPRQIEWVMTGYLFFFSVLLLTGGRLGDLCGYRRLFICGLTAFGVASAGCGLATSPEMLIAMRIFQGISGAMMGPQILSLVQVLYPPHERFRVMSIFGLLGGAAGILGPILGGAIIESNLFGLSWRPIFLINVPIIIVAIMLAWRVLPAVKSPEAKGIDLLGTLLAIIGGGAILLTLIEMPALGWPAWSFSLPVLAIITLCGLARYLLAREKSGKPLLLPPGGAARRLLSRRIQHHAALSGCHCLTAACHRPGPANRAGVHSVSDCADAYSLRAGGNVLDYRRRTPPLAPAWA